MEETYVWAGFILGLILIWPFLFIRLLSYSYIMYALLISLISLRIDQLAIPKGVFWTCFTLLLPSAFVNNSLGTPLMSMIIFFYFWTNHAYWAPTAFVIDFGIFLAFLPPTVTWSQILAWLVALATLGHNTIVWDMPWPWVAAWAALAVALKLSFPPDLHMSWYVLSASLILALAAATRPDQSLERFLAWTAAIALTRPLLSVAYKPLAPYLRDPVKLITAIPAFWESKWRLRKPLWYPVSARAAVSGMQPTSRLCAKCGRFTARSDLIMGSRKYLVRLVEWHSYHPTTADLWRSAREVSPCHLCHLFWYSIGEGRRREIVLGAVWPRAGRVKEKLRVRVVERRPLSSYTYVQLFLGERPVGVRLLVHREVRLDKLSLASQFPRTDSDEHFKQIKEWLEMCSTCHPQCSGVGSAPHALPTRLVYIEPEQPASQSDPPSLNVNLVETAQLADHDVKYLALSHCWGSTVPLRLVTDTYAPFLSSIPFHSLAKNMQHALLATHRLGFSYIWIDSLCIIQDSATDWVAEGARMATVYSGATLTLASTSSASSAGGLFHTRSPLSLRPCIIGYSSLTALLPSTIIARPDDITAFTHSIDQSILNTRAWVLQERLLSRRIAHFATNMLAWECASRSASELSTRGYVFKRYPEDFTDFYAPNAARIRNTTELAAALKLVRATSWLAHEAIRRRPPHLPDADPDAPVAKASAWTERRAFWAQARKAEDGSWASDSSDHVRAGFRAAFAGLLKGTYLREEGGAALIGPGRFSYAWFEIVGAYSRARVSFARDRWLALEGVVAEVRRATGFRYVAGLWKQFVLVQMLWFASEGPGERVVDEMPLGAGGGVDGERVKVPMAPSWSWASTSAPVALNLLPQTALHSLTLRRVLTTVHEVTTHAVPGHGTALAGEILISGPVSKGWVSRTVDGGLEVRVWGLGWGLTVGGKHFRGGTWLRGLVAARFFPDAEGEAGEGDEVACLGCLVLGGREEGVGREEIQGVVLAKRGRAWGRIGFFVGNGRDVVGAFAEGEADRIRIV